MRDYDVALDFDRDGVLCDMDIQLLFSNFGAAISKEDAAALVELFLHTSETKSECSTRTGLKGFAVRHVWQLCRKMTEV